MAFFNQLDVIKTSSKPQRSWSSGRIFEWPQFPKLHFWGIKIFSEFFSLRSGLGLGLRLPRQHTAAQGSRGRPRFRGPAAPGGEGGRGCGGQMGSWPRRRILGRETSWNTGFRCEEVNEDVDGSVMVEIFWLIFFHNFLESVSKHLHQGFGVVVCEHNYIVPTLWVGVSLNQVF